MAIISLFRSVDIDVKLHVPVAATWWFTFLLWHSWFRLLVILLRCVFRGRLRQPMAAWSVTWDHFRLNQGIKVSLWSLTIVLKWESRLWVEEMTFSSSRSLEVFVRNSRRVNVVADIRSATRVVKAKSAGRSVKVFDARLATAQQSTVVSLVMQLRFTLDLVRWSIQEWCELFEKDSG